MYVKSKGVKGRNVRNLRCCCNTDLLVSPSTLKVWRKKYYLKKIKKKKVHDKKYWHFYGATFFSWFFECVFLSQLSCLLSTSIYLNDVLPMSKQWGFKMKAIIFVTPLLWSKIICRIIYSWISLPTITTIMYYTLAVL